MGPTWADDAHALSFRDQLRMLVEMIRFVLFRPEPTMRVLELVRDNPDPLTDVVGILS